MVLPKCKTRECCCNGDLTSQEMHESLLLPTSKPGTVIASSFLARDCPRHGTGIREKLSWTTGVLYAALTATLVMDLPTPPRLDPASPKIIPARMPINPVFVPRYKRRWLDETRLDASGQVQVGGNARRRIFSQVSRATDRSDLDRGRPSLRILVEASPPRDIRKPWT